MPPSTWPCQGADHVCGTGPAATPQSAAEVSRSQLSAQPASKDPIQDLLSLDTTLVVPKTVEMPSGLPTPRVGPQPGPGKAQAPARTSFGGEKDPFYDSSDDEAAADGNSFAGLDGLAPARSTGQRFKVRDLSCLAIQVSSHLLHATSATGILSSLYVSSVCLRQCPAAFLAPVP